ncbi:methionine aminopeptidase 1-like [Thomomys bottae]
MGPASSQGPLEIPNPWISSDSDLNSFEHLQFQEQAVYKFLLPPNGLSVTWLPAAASWLEFCLHLCDLTSMAEDTNLSRKTALDECSAGYGCHRDCLHPLLKATSSYVYPSMETRRNRSCGGLECIHAKSKSPDAKSRSLLFIMLKLPDKTCIKLGIQGSYFCSQECFKGSWATHKLLHKKAKPEKAKREVSSWTVEGDINTGPWTGYRYTGKLRPHYPLMPTRPVPSYIQRPDYADHPLGMSESEQALKGTSQIKLISSEDIEGMRLICRLAREVLDIAAGMIKPGVTTEEIDHAVHLACIARNCYPFPLNYYNFPKSCCTSVNEVICHGIPDRQPLQEGDIVNVDITLYPSGYHGDLNETFFVRDVDGRSTKLVQMMYECLMQAIDAVKPGVQYRELGNLIQKHAQASGFSVVRSYCGHEIHKLFHTAPNVPHYAKNKADGVMKSGYVFTIEPMICEGGWQDETCPDGWTAVTRNGKRSTQFEHTLLGTDTGCEILTRRLDSAWPHLMSQF